MNDAILLRRELHSYPDVSGSERQTAKRILGHFERLGPDATIVGLGGTGLAFVFAGSAPGPTVMFRCELDALPIPESLDVPHRSRVEGVSHKCGHDGHMAILAGVGSRLARSLPRRGRVVLLFQPAEETGSGAEAVLADARFDGVRPDHVFALHNVPGRELGRVVVREGVFCCASRGVVVRLSGRTAHAAQPETGISPAGVMCRLIDELGAIASTPGFGEGDFATVVGARLGGKTFGTAPGEAEIYATLRAGSDATMNRMVAHLASRVETMSHEAGLRAWITYEDVFEATVNAARAVETIGSAATRLGLAVEDLPLPFRWSEDFGRFTSVANGALFGLGSGVGHPDLHDPDFDFPDELVPIAVELLLEIVNELVG